MILRWAMAKKARDCRRARSGPDAASPLRGSCPPPCRSLLDALFGGHLGTLLGALFDPVQIPSCKSPVQIPRCKSIANAGLLRRRDDPSRFAQPFAAAGKVRLDVGADLPCNARKATIAGSSGPHRPRSPRRPRRPRSPPGALSSVRDLSAATSDKRAPAFSNSSRNILSSSPAALRPQGSAGARIGANAAHCLGICPRKTRACQPVKLSATAATPTPVVLPIRGIADASRRASSAPAGLRRDRRPRLHGGSRWVHAP
jgi:hypothetical protein